VRLLVSRARVRSDRWDLVGARSDAEAALAGAASTGDRSVEAAAILRLGDIDQRAGDTAAAAARLRHAADRFAADGDERGRGEALRLLGMTQMFAGEMDDAAASVTEAREAFELAQDRAGQGWAAQNLAWIAMLEGDLDETEAEVDRAVALFAEVDETVGRAWARGLLAFVRFSQGRRADAKKLADEILGEASNRGDRWATAMMRGLLGSLHLWDGRVAEALEETGAASQAFRDLGDPWGLSVSLATHGRALAMSGDVEEGFAAVRTSAATTHDGRVESPLGVMATLALAVQVGEPERGLVLLERNPPLAAGGTLTPTESEVTLALARVQVGEVVAVPDHGGRAFGYAGSALVAAVAGQVDIALSRAEAVEGCPEATYLDKTLAEVAAGLALVQSGRPEEGLARVVVARAIVEATDDLVGRAMVGLATAVAADVAGDAGAVAERSSAATALARLGLTARGWETAFSLAAGAHPPVEVG